MHGSVLPEQDQRNAVARFLDARDMKAEALHIATDPDYRFDLAGARRAAPSLPTQPPLPCILWRPRGSHHGTWEPLLANVLLGVLARYIVDTCLLPWCRDDGRPGGGHPVFNEGLFCD